MTNTFRKDYGSNGWTILATEQHAEGATVPVRLKSGATKPVKLGRIVGYVYEVDDTEQRERRARYARPEMEDFDGRPDPAFERSR